MSAKIGQIEQQLLRHPNVSAAIVRLCEGESGKKQLAACVATGLPESKSSPPNTSKCWGQNMVDRWKTLYELTYAKGPAAPSFVGWNSSYTRQPISEEQMQAWLCATVARIRALRPRRILEIGCGVGLLLQHLAPSCCEYVGTDISVSAIAKLKAWLRDRGDLKNVTLLHRPATDFASFETGHFDMVVLNSVVQYFPNISYLLTVIERAAELLGYDRHIFIGDVRHLGLLSMFHSAVQLSRETGPATVGELRRRVTRSMAQESELVIDPALFKALPGNLAGIGAADVQLKRGRSPNELTRHRYDVVLRTGNPISPSPLCESVDWQTTFESVSQFERCLQSRRWRALHLTDIPNSRVAMEAMTQRLVDTSDLKLPVSELYRLVTDLKLQDTDPERFWELAEEYGYEASVTWSCRGISDCFDVLLLDRSQSIDVTPAAVFPPKPWNAYANDPWENCLRQQLVPVLKQYLKECMPEEMIPSDWTVVEQISHSLRVEWT